MLVHGAFGVTVTPRGSELTCFTIATNIFDKTVSRQLFYRKFMQTRNINDLHTIINVVASDVKYTPCHCIQ